MTRRLGRGFATFILIGVLAFVSLMVTILLAMAIWPGEAKLTAPIFCDDAHPDAFVVSDSYSVQPGETSTSFTLYCVGPSGEADNAGWMGPFLTLWAGHAVLIVALVVIVLVVVAISRRPRAREAPPKMDESGFPIAPPPP